MYIDKTKQRSNDYRTHLPVLVGGTICTALVDSGNVWHDVISTQLARKLGVMHQLVPGAQSRIGTAKGGAELKILGKVPRALKITTLAHGLEFWSKPYVLEGLTVDFNLAGPTLKRLGAEQLYGAGELRLQGCCLRLTSPRTTKETLTYAPPEVHSLYTTYRREIPAGEAVSIQVVAPTVRSQEGFVVTMGTPGGGADVAIQPEILDVVSNSGEEYQVRVKNFGERPCTLQKGAFCGIAALLPASQRTATGPTEGSSWIDRLRLEESAWLREEGRLGQARELMEEFKDVFSLEGEFGATTLVQHDILIKPEAKTPVTQPYRPVNPNLATALRQQLQIWLNQGIIEPSKSPYNYGLVAVPKKNQEIRWCVDFRPLNDITIKDSYPIGNIEDNLAQLAGSRVFSSIDGAGAFHVVELTESAKEKTAFATPEGHFQFRKMPFGLCNAPSTYARLIQIVLADVPRKCAIAYIDDVVILGTTLTEHFDNVRQVLQAHRQAGLKLKPEKCHFFRKEIDYLGHTVNEKGIQPMEAYIKVVKDWPLPVSRSQVRTFLGKVGYYRKFIRDYAAIAAPLTDKLKQDTLKDDDIFQPTPEIEKAFNTLKKALLSAPILAYPQFDSPQPFILDTDWSQENNAVGAVLSQKQGKEERVIAYGAKRLTSAQAKYPSTKGELAAAIIFMRQWRYYLQYRKFVLRIDNRALLWIRTMERPAGMIQRWLDTLANFDFEVQHRPGKKHGNADSLSRAEHLPPTEDGSTTISDDQIAQLQVEEKEGPLTEKPAIIAGAQRDHEETGPIVRHLQSGKACPTTLHPKAQWLKSALPNLALKDDGVLRYRKETMEAGRSKQVWLTVLPTPLLKATLRRAHSIMAHKSAAATVELASRHVYHPQMLAIAQEVVQECVDCQSHLQQPPKERREVADKSRPGYPFQRIAVDIVGPLPPSTKGNEYLLTVKDEFTRWIEAFPMARATADTIAHLLNTEIIARYGVPEVIHSDQGRQFLSKVMQDLAAQLGITLTCTPAYNPKSNPVERSHRDLKRALTALVGNQPNKWEDMLGPALFAIRTAICQTTKFAPFQLLFGRHPTTPLDMIFGRPTDGHQLDPNRKPAWQEAQLWARQNINDTIQRQRSSYFSVKRKFNDGDKVWLFTPTPTPGPSKFNRYWTGPWTIDHHINPVVVAINPDPAWQRKKSEVVSIDRLKLFFPQENISNPPAFDQVLDRPGDEAAEYITQCVNDDDDDAGDLLPQPQHQQPPRPITPPLPPPPPATNAPPRRHRGRPRKNTEKTLTPQPLLPTRRQREKQQLLQQHMQKEEKRQQQRQDRQSRYDRRAAALQADRRARDQHHMAEDSSFKRERGESPERDRSPRQKDREQEEEEQILEHDPEIVVKEEPPEEADSGCANIMHIRDMTGSD